MIEVDAQLEFWSERNATAGDWENRCNRPIIPRVSFLLIAPIDSLAAFSVSRSLSLTLSENKSVKCEAKKPQHIERITITTITAAAAVAAAAKKKPTNKQSMAYHAKSQSFQFPRNSKWGGSPVFCFVSTRKKSSVKLGLGWTESWLRLAMRASSESHRQLWRVYLKVWVAKEGKKIHTHIYIFGRGYFYYPTMNLLGKVKGKLFHAAARGLLFFHAHFFVVVVAVVCGCCIFLKWIIRIGSVVVITPSRIRKK